MAIVVVFTLWAVANVFLFMYLEKKTEVEQVAYSREQIRAMVSHGAAPPPPAGPTGPAAPRAPRSADGARSAGPRIGAERTGSRVRAAAVGPVGQAPPGAPLKAFGQKLYGARPTGTSDGCKRPAADPHRGAHARPRRQGGGLLARAANGKLQCDLCAQLCKINDGHVGVCGVRKVNRGQALLARLLAALRGPHRPDREEAALPLPPDTKVLSFGTIGCNMRAVTARISRSRRRGPT